MGVFLIYLNVLYTVIIDNKIFLKLDSFWELFSFIKPKFLVSLNFVPRKFLYSSEWSMEL